MSPAEEKILRASPSTRACEDNALDILMGNLDWLWRGDKTLRNQVL